MIEENYKQRGEVIDSLRRELSETKSELEKYIRGAVSYNNEIYERGLEIRELKEELNMGDATYAWCEKDYKNLKSEILELLEDMKIYIDTINDDHDRRKMHIRIDAFLKRLKGEG